jgi:uncharacterized membrane-anchored protein
LQEYLSKKSISLPFGATFGDFLTKPGGLELSRFYASLVALGVFVLLLVLHIRLDFRKSSGDEGI